MLIIESASAVSECIGDRSGANNACAGSASIPPIAAIHKNRGNGKVYLDELIFQINPVLHKLFSGVIFVIDNFVFRLRLRARVA